MPAAPGLGTPFDLGPAAGAFKTFILRGAIAPGSRYTVLDTIDGVRFDEVMLFTSDQRGARPVEFSAASAASGTPLAARRRCRRLEAKGLA